MTRLHTVLYTMLDCIRTAHEISYFLIKHCPLAVSMMLQIDCCRYKIAQGIPQQCYFPFGTVRVATSKKAALIKIFVTTIDQLTNTYLKRLLIVTNAKYSNPTLQYPSALRSFLVSVQLIVLILCPQLHCFGSVPQLRAVFCVIKH